MSPLGRLVGLTVFIPIEIGARVIGSLPDVVERIPFVADRVRREIVLARFIGKLAVDHGVDELQKRTRPRPSTSPAATFGDTSDRAAPVPTIGVEVPSAPDVDTLALSDYDHLSSAQIVAKLDGLDRPERDGIEAYERSGRHRRTILGKLDQLRSTP